MNKLTDEQVKELSDEEFYQLFCSRSLKAMPRLCFDHTYPGVDYDFALVRGMHREADGLGYQVYRHNKTGELHGLRIDNAF